MKTKNFALAGLISIIWVFIIVLISKNSTHGNIFRGMTFYVYFKLTQIAAVGGGIIFLILRATRNLEPYFIPYLVCGFLNLFICLFIAISRFFVPTNFSFFTELLPSLVLTILITFDITEVFEVQSRNPRGINRKF